MKPIPTSSAGLAAGLIFENRYRLEEVIGFGGMGQVWSATHVSMGHQVAIKVLHGNVVQDDDARLRFIREARVMEALGDMSRHITRVLEHGILGDGVPYLIMERLQGEGLDVLLKRQRVLPLPRVADIVGQLCKALAITHAEELIHRDIKPANIFICPDKNDPEKIFVKLLDFGVVKVLSEVGESTLQGQIIGTPNYMSPEQLTPKATIDHRADLFAVGAIAYRCATGRVAFGKGTPHEMVQRVLQSQPPAPTSINPSLPPAFDAFIAKALAKRPEERFQTARELAETLQRIAENPSDARSSLSSIFTDSPTGATSTNLAALPLPRPSASPRKSRGPLLVGVTAVLALAAAGSFVALRPPPAPARPLPPAPPSAPTPTTAPAASASAALAASAASSASAPVAASASAAPAASSAPASAASR